MGLEVERLVGVDGRAGAANPAAGRRAGPEDAAVGGAAAVVPYRQVVGRGAEHRGDEEGQQVAARGDAPPPAAAGAPDLQNGVRHNWPGEERRRSTKTTTTRRQGVAE